MASLSIASSHCIQKNVPMLLFLQVLFIGALFTRIIFIVVQQHVHPQAQMDACSM
jgi:hypothetical protein